MRRRISILNRSPYRTQEIVGIIRNVWGNLPTGDVFFDVGYAYDWTFLGTSVDTREDDPDHPIILTRHGSDREETLRLPLDFRRGQQYIRILIGPRMAFPCHILTPYKDLPLAPHHFAILNWQEALANGIGHELAHCAQRYLGLPYDHDHDETTAEWFGVSALARHRKKYGIPERPLRRFYIGSLSLPSHRNLDSFPYHTFLDKILALV